MTASGRVLVPVNFRLAPTRSRYIVEHCGASRAARRPRARRARSRDVERRAPVRARRGERRRSCCASTPSRARGPTRRGRDRDDQLHAAGRRRGPRASQLTHRNLWLNAVTLRLHMRASATATSTCTRCRCSTATAGACRTRWPALGRAAGRAAQGRRRRDPAPRRAARRDADGRRPGGVEHRARRRRDWDGAIPGRGRVRDRRRAARRRRRARSRASRSELGWEFIQIYGLTETVAAADDQPRRAPEDDDARADERARRQLTRAGAPALGVRAGDQRRRRGARPRQPRPRGLLGATRRPPPRRWTDGWFHTGDGGRSTTTAT